MLDRDPAPGPLAADKRDQASDDRRPRPVATEVESARLLANETRAALVERGLTEEQIDRLADLFVAEDLGEDSSEFIEWAAGRARAEGSPSSDA